MHLAELSRQDTTWAKHAHLAQLPLAAQPGSRRWVRDNLELRIAESRADIAEVSDIVLRRHYLRRRAVPPRTLVLTYLGSLGGRGACALAQVALLPANLRSLTQALDLHPCEVLTLTRCWRADDLGPDTAPGLMPLVLRRAVRRLAQDWTGRKCANLSARPKVLVTHADPEQGHDGGLYAGAGAVALGQGASGKLLFCWALDEGLRVPLGQYAQARAERQIPRR